MRTVLFTGLAVSVFACGKPDDGKTNGDKAAHDVQAESTQSKVDDSPTQPRRELAQVGFSIGDQAVAMTTPLGTTVSERFGNTIVEASNGTFRLEIGVGHADIAARKADIEANTVNRLERFAIDQPLALLYESKVAGASEYHLLVNTTAGKLELSCEDSTPVEDSKGTAYSESNAMAMLEACKSISAGR